MRTLRNLHVETDASYGGRIDDEQPSGAASMLPFADPGLVARCREYWPESSEDQWEWNLGKRQMFVRHLESGQMLRITTGIPGDGGELASAVRCWLVRDGRLILLEEPGGARPTRSVFLATYEPEGRQLASVAPPPMEGQIW